MSDLGLLSYYLIIEVVQGPAGITLCQAAYTRKILERCSMATCNSTTTPMENRLKLSKSSDKELVDASDYRSIIGVLRYLLHTRPDLTFTVGYLSRFMEDPHEDHLMAVKRVMRYITGTQEHVLFCTRLKDGLAKLVGYSDTDMAGDIDSHKSTSGVIFFLGGNLISWQSTKQRVVVLSSCKAEYMAAVAATCQGIWLAHLLIGMLGSEVEAPELWVDNQSTIALSKNPVFHDRSKHIDVRYHFVRECVDEYRIKLSYIATEKQVADVLTKALGLPRFQELRFE
jgi:hypothetical protein